MVKVGFMRKINIALCQIKVLDNKEKNLARAENLISDAAAKGVDFVILPEMFNCPYDRKYFPIFAEGHPGRTTGLLAALARRYSIYIIGGSIPEKEKSKIYNTSFVFDRDGKLIAKHRKIHLFDVTLKGGIDFKESDTFSPGSKLTVFNSEFGKIGIAICYDMRFPELIRKMVLQDAKIVIVPAAFNMTTGPAHWHITARTRALDNQIYFVAVSTARNKKASYVSYGHSLVVDPWGKIVAEAGIDESIITAEIDLDYIHEIRSELPLLKHRKEELYK
jgi:predicted amidohydrolase